MKQIDNINNDINNNINNNKAYQSIWKIVGLVIILMSTHE